MRLISKAVFVGMFTLVLQTPAAQAETIDQYINGPWLVFGWASWLGDETVGCQPADPNGMSCMIYGDAVPAPPPPWTFTAPENGAQLTVLDAAWLVDSFDVYDNGSYIGSTSPLTCSSTPCTEYCSSDPDICVNDPDASKGVFMMESGLHAITIIPTETSSSVGAGYLRVDAIGADADGDGIADVDDDCPNDPEDFDGFEDEDGCPDPDHDSDGVLDSDDSCPESDIRETVILQQCDSGVTNTVFDDGCSISDKLATCLNGTLNHCSYVSCVADMVDELNTDDILDGGETGSIISCAARMI